MRQTMPGPYRISPYTRTTSKVAVSSTKPESKRQSLQRHQRHATFRIGSLPDSIFRATHHPGMDHSRAKQAIGCNTQRPMQRQPDRRGGVQGRTGKHQRQQDRAGGQRTQYATQPKLWIEPGLDGIHRTDQPGRDRQGRREAEMRRGARKTERQNQRMQHPAQQQNQPAGTIADAMPRGRHKIGNGSAPREDMGRHGATG